MAGGRQSKHNRSRRNLRSQTAILDSPNTFLHSSFHPTLMQPVTPTLQRHLPSSPFDPAALAYPGMFGGYVDNPYTPSLSAGDTSYVGTPCPEPTPEPYPDIFSGEMTKLTWNDENMTVGPSAAEDYLSSGSFGGSEVYADGMGLYHGLEDHLRGCQTAAGLLTP